MKSILRKLLIRTSYLTELFCKEPAVCFYHFKIFFNSVAFSAMHQAGEGGGSLWGPCLTCPQRLLLCVGTGDMGRPMQGWHDYPMLSTALPPNSCRTPEAEPRQASPLESPGGRRRGWPLDGLPTCPAGMAPGLVSPCTSRTLLPRPAPPAPDARR